MTHVGIGPLATLHIARAHKRSRSDGTIVASEVIATGPGGVAFTGSTEIQV